MDSALHPMGEKLIIKVQCLGFSRAQELLYLMLNCCNLIYGCKGTNIFIITAKGKKNQEGGGSEVSSLSVILIESDCNILHSATGLGCNTALHEANLMPWRLLDCMY